MPHLHDNSEAEEKVGDTNNRKMPTQKALKTNSSLTTQMPIKEAREATLTASGRTVSASPSSSPPATVKIASFESAEEERTPEDTSSPQARLPKQIITPSPYGPVSRSDGRPDARFGPMLSIYGSNRLFPSPIRVKKRSSNLESDNERSSPSPPHMIQPSHLRYAGAFTPTPPPKRADLQRMLSTDSSASRSKRPVEQIMFEEPKKKLKTDSSSTLGGAETGSVDDERGRNSPGDSTSSSKKTAISPSSSGDKGEELSAAAPRPGVYGYSGRPYMHGYPHPSAFAPHLPYGTPPPYPSPYQMYGAYPPPHYMPGHPAGHPPFYPPYPPHHHAMGTQYRPHGKYPFPESPYRPNVAKPMGMAPMTPADDVSDVVETPTQNNDSPYSPASVGSSANSSNIKSVADWQQAAMTTGKPPSAGRCLPLKEPIPSRYWGEAEKTKDAILPDFHRLVNYPDYLAKSRGTSSDASVAPAGKKNCVMCGKLRVCSATSLVNRSKPKADESVSAMEDEEDGSAHIIPRQNKGLCTACDVTVWVVVSDGLEIKWCKGCKNFRPWAAFGDKGSATKCVRCRDRQREKYAMQKDEIRLRRYKRSSSPDSSSPSSTTRQAGAAANDQKSGPWEDRHRDEETHMAAARGLRNLMNAASV